MLLLLTMACTGTSAPQVGRPPNIIILLVDDAGYADFGFMGSPDLATPHLDRIAEQGMIFTDAHVTASVCAPSRAGLLTGRYQQRSGFECNPPEHFSGLDLDHPTLAEVLGKAGYISGAFGKWHLGDSPANHPQHRGFDYSWGFLAGGRHYFPNPQNDQPGDTRCILENGQFASFEGYLTDVLGQKAAEFIDRHADQPFFMYWAPNAVHTPMEATEADLARFAGHPRQKLAAMTWALDRAVGQIVGKLEEHDILDQTLIFFLSDNGGAANNQSTNGPLKGFKGNEFEGGHRVAFVAHWPGHIGPGQRYEGLTSSLDIFATAVDAAGISLPANSSLDGVSLLPYFRDPTLPAPHQRLFWRKDHMAAARLGDLKLIQVDQLGHRLYDLKTDLAETHDLADSLPETLDTIQANLRRWEQHLLPPQWTEPAAWDTVTWLIHQDLFNNQTVRVTSPTQLKQ